MQEAPDSKRCRVTHLVANVTACMQCHLHCICECKSSSSCTLGGKDIHRKLYW